MTDEKGLDEQEACSPLHASGASTSVVAVVQSPIEEGDEEVEEEKEDENIQDLSGLQRGK